MKNKILYGLGFIIVVGVGIYFGTQTTFDGSSTSSKTITQTQTTQSVKTNSSTQNSSTKKITNVNESNVIEYITPYLATKGYKFVTVAPKDISIFTGQPGNITPKDLNTKLLDGFKGNLLSAGNLESPNYIVSAKLDGKPVYLINMINPYLLRTYSGNAFTLVVGEDGHIYTLAEVSKAIENGKLTDFKESYPYKFFYTEDGMQSLTAGNGSFLYGKYI